MPLLGLLLLLAPPDPVDGADSDSWRERWRSVEAIASLPESEHPRLRRALLEEARPRVREAIAFAAWREPAIGDSTLLGLALRRDRSPAVRRAAARALVHFPDRRAIGALIEALSRETDARTRLRIVATLRELTPAPCLLDAAEWSSWWERHASDPRFLPADEKALEREYEGVPLETRTVAAVPSGDAKKRAFPHLLVLPQFGWSNEEWGPALLPFRTRASVTYVRLPSVARLTGRSGFGEEIPVYPVDRLVRALEAFREDRRIGRFLLLAHGASGWFAIRYAQLHPDRCAALLLLDTHVDKASYAAALERALAKGDAGERFAAETLTHRNRAPFVPATLDRLQADALARAFHDPADLEIGWLFRYAREPEGFATVPEIAYGGRTTIDVPTLFLYSAGTPMSGHVDRERIERHFPRSMIAPILESRGLPFVEEPDAFHRIAGAFLDRFAPE